MLPHVPEVDLVQQAHPPFPRRSPAIREALQHGEVIEHVVGGDPRIDAEVLRQVAQRAAQRVGIREHVDVAEADRALRRDLQRRDAAHQRRLAGAVRAQQPEHAARAPRGIIAVEGARAVRIDVGQVVDPQHENLPQPGLAGPYGLES